MNNGQFLKVNPAVMAAIRKQFDRWYTDEGGPVAANRRKLEQRIALAAMGDDDRATEIGLSRDKRLKIKRDQKSKQDDE